MKKIYKLASIAVLGLVFNTQSINAQMVSDFESVPLAPESYWDGSDLSGLNFTTDFTTIFKSGTAEFLNVWDTAYGTPGYWAGGFAQSTYTDSMTSGPGNIYSTKAARGNDESLTYLTSYNYSILRFAGAPTIVSSIHLTNSTYAYNSMRDGDNIAKKFGGVTGDDEDWFKVTIKGFDENGIMTSDSVDFYLADFRDADNANDYIFSEWQLVDLTSMGEVSGLLFILSSSDVGNWGLNTPAYFCIDDIKPSNDDLIDFEDLGFTAKESVWDGSDLSGEPNDLNYLSLIRDGDASFFNAWTIAYGGYWAGGFAFSNVTDTITSGYTNSYSAKPASGALGSANYAIVKNGSSVNLLDDAANSVMNGIYISNSTYAYNSMRDGDTFGKKFGGDSGDDEDWFKLTIKGYNNGVKSIDSVDFYLADFRNSDNSKDYILNTWANIDLSTLGAIDSVSFHLSSSDVDPVYGMNTPAYFAMDNFNGLVSSVRGLEVASVSIYPNPAKNQIQITTEIGFGSVEIYDLKGSLKLIENNVSNQSVINIETLNSGVYVVKYVEGEKVFTQRLIVQ